MHFILSVTLSGKADIFSCLPDNSFNSSSRLADTATFQPSLANFIAKDLFSAKYKKRVVKPKKGKGSYKRKKIKLA